MNEITHANLLNIYSTDHDLQNQAFSALLDATETRVDWAYDAWDELLAALRHPDNHVRAIAAQVLCNLAKSDPDLRMLHDLDSLLAVTYDERFVTARHCMQSLWKIGAAGTAQRARLLSGLTRRFEECAAEKNTTLIRFDIQGALRKVYDAAPDEDLRRTALELIETEPDIKYRKKYAVVWRGIPK